MTRVETSRFWWLLQNDFLCKIDSSGRTTSIVVQASITINKFKYIILVQRVVTVHNIIH
jgi:hypothetical protein